MVGDTASTTYPFSAGYKYHANGTVSEAQFYNAGSPATAKRYKYAFGTTSYDALNRLKSADFSSWSGTAWTSTLAHDLTGITYDRSGNLTALQRYRETATLVDNLTYTNAGTSNRLTSVADAIATTAETWDAEAGAFTYDANGNLKTAPAPYSLTAVTYDQQNLPITLTAAGTTTNYRYNQVGQRITKQVGTGNTEFYLLEGASPLGVFTLNTSGTLVSWYFSVMAGDQVVGRHPNTGSRVYYHPDLLGSTRAVVAGTTVTEAYDFEPFGLLMPGRSLLGSTKERYTGKEQDSESGLTYFGARYYLSALGRWAAPDAMASRMPEWSTYNYVLGNPMGDVDPDGNLPITKIAKLGVKVLKNGVSKASAADAFRENIEQVKTLLDPTASTAAKVVAGVSLLVDVVSPVGVGDIKFIKGAGRAKAAAKAVDGADPVMDASRAAGGAARAAPGEYTVGLYDDIRGTVPGMDAHHVGQKALMRDLIPGYDPATAPAILVPKVGHTIRGPNGILSRSTEGLTSARDVIARDIRELRRVYPDIPNSQLQRLIQMNKNLYPTVNR